MAIAKKQGWLLGAVLMTQLAASSTACSESTSPGPSAGSGASGESGGAAGRGGAGQAGGSAAGAGAAASEDGGGVRPLDASAGDVAAMGATGEDAAARCTATNGGGSAVASVVVNGDIGAGLTGWSSFGPSVLTVVTQPARSGNALAIAGRTDTWNGASQSLLGRATSGQLLQVSAWVRVDAVRAPVDFALKTTIAGKDTYAQLGAVVANAAGWTQLNGTVTLSWAAEPTSALLYVEGPPAGVTIYVDDVTAVVRSPSAGSGVGNADGTVTVRADIGEKHQTLEGFGASLAWYQDDLVHHPKAEEIYPLLFRDLGLDIVRFRNRYQRSTEAVDLTTEATLFAKAAASLGRAPKLIMTSWSPPAALKASGQELCTGDATTCTLAKPGGAYPYDAFATYWSESLDAYAAKNIVPDFISIQNETDFVPNGWEGCTFAPQESATLPGYDKALAAVAHKLAARATRPKLLGPETLGVHWNRLQAYAPALDATLLYGWAHHLYEKGSGPVWLWQDPGPDAFIAPMLGALQVEVGKPIFMTEFQTDEDTIDSGGFETAWLMHDSLSDGDASAWLYWNLVWPNGGMVALEGASYRVRDQYYAVRHYAKFTEPADTRVGASSNLPAIRATAWLAADQSRLTMVLLNVGASEKSVHLAPCGYPFTRSSVVRTTFHGDGTSKRWEELGSLPADPMVQLPARAVATVVLQR